MSIDFSSQSTWKLLTNLEKKEIYNTFATDLETVINNLCRETILFPGFEKVTKCLFNFTIKVLKKNALSIKDRKAISLFLEKHEKYLFSYKKNSLQKLFYYASFKNEVELAQKTFKIAFKDFYERNDLDTNEKLSPLTDDEKRLLYACTARNLELVKKILESDVDVNKIDPVTQLNPLMSICNLNINQSTKNKHTYIDICTLLLKKNANVNKKNPKGYTPLIIACQNHNLDMVQFLLQNGAKTNDKTHNSGISALHEASMRGDLKIIQLLKEYAPLTINSKTIEGCTPLYLAWVGKHFQVATYLIEQGADINATMGTEPVLHISLKNNYPLEQISYLLEKGANPNYSQNDFSPIHFACIKGNLELVKLLIKYGAKTDSIDATGYTPFEKIFYSCATNQAILAPTISLDPNRIEIANVLMEQKNFNPNYRNKQGLTLLFIASMFGELEIGRILLEKGADPSKNSMNLTPFLIACLKGNLSFAALLYQYENQPAPDLLRKALSNELITKSVNRKIFDDYFHLFKLPLLSLLELPAMFLPLTEACNTLTELEEMLCQHVSSLSTHENPLKIVSYLGSQKLLNVLKKTLSPLAFEELIVSKPSMPNTIFKIDSSHFSKGIQTEINNTSNWDIKKLDSIFKTINFVDPFKDNFRDLNAMSFFGQRHTLSELQEGLKEFMKRTKQNKEYYAVLKNIGIHLETLDAEEQKTYVIEFAAMGIRCENTLAELYRICAILNKSLPSNFNERIYLELLTIRENIITKWSKDEEAPELETHRFSQLMHLVGKELHLTHSKVPLFDKEDTFLSFTLNKKNKDSILKEFYKAYSPAFLIESFKSLLWNIYLSNQDEVVDWLKDNLPDYWRQDYYQNLILSAQGMDREKAQKYFLQNSIALDPLILNIEDALLNYRKIHYLYEEAFEMNDMENPTGFKSSCIKNLLLKLGILKV